MPDYSYGVRGVPVTKSEAEMSGPSDDEVSRFYRRTACGEPEILGRGGHYLAGTKRRPSAQGSGSVNVNKKKSAVDQARSNVEYYAAAMREIKPELSVKKEVPSASKYVYKGRATGKPR